MSPRISALGMAIPSLAIAAIGAHQILLGLVQPAGTAIVALFAVFGVATAILAITAK